MKKFATAIFALLAWLPTACGEDVRAIELADVDFTDMTAVQEIRRKLPSEDRAAFATFVVRHVATSPSFCGETLVDEDGRLPRTIGEALALTVLREERDRRERLAAERPLTAAELLQQKREDLIAQRETLIGRKDYLLSEHGPAAEQLPEWKTIDAQMADYEAQLKALPSRPE